ncbi:MAG: SIMPL domain-containing protein [Oscillospiraceae bacterium]|nr:SIMPL domain-containing protein [Oscillospiraceae bacterium]
MDRTITVQGTGQVRVPPDTVSLSMSVSARYPSYDEAVTKCQEQADRLIRAAAEAGHDREQVKTISFHVTPEYDSVQENGIFRSVFSAYRCQQDLKLDFDYSRKALAAALDAVRDSGADPELRIGFTVKEPEKVREQILRNAAENARQKAEILCSASGVSLGRLIRIDYHRDDSGLYSETAMYRNSGVAMAKMAVTDSFTPAEIEKSDSAAFVWEIL